MPHLRQAALAVTAVLALAVVCAVAWTPRPRAAARPLETTPRSTVPVPQVEEPPYAPPSGLRNVFEFEDQPAPAAPPPAPLPSLVVPPPLDPGAMLEPADEPVRLVGFVRRGGALRAALSLSGTVAVLAPGEQADGYFVLAVDEDAGVTVRTPDGSEQVLPPPDP